MTSSVVCFVLATILHLSIAKAGWLWYTPDKVFETFNISDRRILRTRRSAGNDDEHFNPKIMFHLPREIICKGQCLSSMTKTLGHEFKEAANGVIHPAIYQKRNFELFCSLYKKGIRCLRECGDTGDSEAEKLLDHLFKSVKYLCIDRRKDFLKHMPCYAETQPEVEKVCDPKCGNLTELEKLEEGQEKAELQVRLVVMKDKLDQSCNFLKCHVSCSTPIMNQICRNHKPAKFLQGFVAQVFRDSELKFKEMDLEEFWPQSCQDVTRGRFGMKSRFQTMIENFGPIFDVENSVESAVNTNKDISSRSGTFHFFSLNVLLCFSCIFALFK